jgi:hypothetical protein
MGFKLSDLVPTVLGAGAGFLLSGGNPIGALVGAGLGSSVGGAGAARDAADTQAQAGREAIAAQERMFGVTQQNIRPYLDLGAQYAGTLASLGATDPRFADMGPMRPGSGSYATQQFGPAELAAGLAPNYEWVKQQGLMAANNQASALGGVAGTGGMRSAIDYATNLAGNAYQQAFNNYQSQRNSIFGNLRDIASLGSNAAVGQGTISSNVGNSIGNTITGIGNAQAAGGIGAANAIAGGIGNAIGGYGYLTNMGLGSGPNTVPGWYARATSPGAGAWNAQNGADLNTLNFSDIRLKEDIKPIGFTKKGTPLYKWKWKGSGTEGQGVLAQEVLGLDPTAVAMDRDGVLMVDYAKV